jgi:DNA-binding transcriptional ArsR family regulator
MSLRKLPAGFEKKVFGKFLQIFKAVGNEKRLQILASLIDGSKTYSEA